MKRPNEELNSLEAFWADSAYEPASLLSGSTESGFVALEEVDARTVASVAPSLLKQQAELEKSEGTNVDPSTNSSTAKKQRKKSKRSDASAVLQAEPSLHREDDHKATDAQEEVDISAWKEYALHKPLEHAIAQQGYSQPLPIQRECLPVAINEQTDIIGAAETGSGKTLAFALPVLQQLVYEQEVAAAGHEDSGGRICRAAYRSKCLRCLVLCPTRELALQVASTFRVLAAYTDVRVTTIVGGIAPPKQLKRLAKRPEIVVATPGRLWEHMSNAEEHLQDLSQLSFLVIDEADRMIEKGHFKELQNILTSLPFPYEQTKHNMRRQNQRRKTQSPSGEIGADSENAVRTSCQCVPRQTFVFSATLTLPQQLRKQLKLKGAGAPATTSDQNGSSYSEGVKQLFDRITFRTTPRVIDLTQKGIGLPERLEESAIECVADQKDALLYYLLVMHSGRCLVFCNSGSSLKRLARLLTLLDVTVNTMHSGMQQRQRLKAIDRFKQRSNGVMIATDVAARGIDIPSVRMVVHYHLAPSVEVYLHRCGRTARAASDGISIALISPADKSKYTRLCNAMERDELLPRFPVERDLLSEAEARVNTAAKVEQLDKAKAQARSSQSWMKRKMREMDQFTEDDDDNAGDERDDGNAGRMNVAGNNEQDKESQRAQLKAKLAKQLQKPLRSEAPSSKYPTKESSSALRDRAPQKQDAVSRKRKRRC